MNFPDFLLTPMIVTRAHLPDCLFAILQTIAFQRNLSTTNPTERYLPDFDVTIVMCQDDPDLQKLISVEIGRILEDAKAVDNFEVYFSFHRLARGWFGTKPGDCWERWRIPIQIRPSDEEIKRTMKEELIEIVSKVDRNRDHVPPASDKDFFVMVITSTAAKKGWGLF